MLELAAPMKTGLPETDNPLEDEIFSQVVLGCYARMSLGEGATPFDEIDPERMNFVVMSGLVMAEFPHSEKDLNTAVNHYSQILATPENRQRLFTAATEIQE